MIHHIHQKNRSNIQRYIASVVLILFLFFNVAETYAACTRNAPSVVMSPMEGTVAGVNIPKIYDIAIMNNDKEDTPGDCGATSFALAFSQAQSGTSFNTTATAISTTPVSVAVGALGHSNLTVRTAATITPYQTLTVTVNASSAAHAGSKIGKTTVISRASNNKGDGNLLVRSDEETCHSCHKTDLNRAPSSSDWGEAIKTHNSQIMGSSKWNASAGWGVAGGKYGRFVCTTCHTPHNTKNLYLVRMTITTPDGSNFNGRAVNYVTVNFSKKSGAAGDAGTMGDDSSLHATSNKICEVCHNQDPSQSQGVNKHAYNMNATTTHYNAQDCTGCHGHKVAFAAGESGGGTDCDTCHGNIYAVMNSTASGGYHHYMYRGYSGTAASAGTTVYNVLTPQANVFGAGGGATSMARRCLICHVDHDTFRPDANTNASSGRGANLRLDIATRPPANPTGANFTNTDFVYDNTYGGICLSCHSYTQERSYWQTGAANQTVALSQANYNATAHNYTTNSTFNGAKINYFQANCSKCHNDTTSKAYQVSALPAQFANHNSTVSKVITPLNATASQYMEENFCYKCHSNSNENLKPTANKDYYGTADMTTNSQRLYNNFATVRGTATAASTTSITDSSKNWGAGTWGNYSVTILNGTYSGRMRRITSNNGTVLNVSTQFGGTPVVGTKYQIGGVHGVVDSNGSHKPVEGTAAGWMPNATRHVECEDCHNPHAASPGTSWAFGNVTSAAANTVTIQGPASGKTWPNDRWKDYTITVRNATSNGQVRYIAGNTGNTLTIIGNWTVTPTTSFNYTMRTSTFSDGGVATGGSATTLVDTTRAGNWTTNQWAGYYVKVVSGATGAKEQVRKITANTNQNLTVASWTATAAGAGYVIYRPPVIAGANNGVSGVNVTIDTDAAMRNVTYSYKATATTQYELCLKCHSTWAFTNEDTVRLPSSYPAGPNANWSTGLNATDIGRDFDPDNYGYHPLFAPGKHQPIRMGDPSGNFVNGTIAYNTNWPKQVIVNATRINATLGSAIIRANANTTFDAGIGAGYWIFIGNGTPPNPANSTWAGVNRGWWPVASRDSATQLTLKVPYTWASVSNNASYITKGFKSTFVDGWGPESLVTCTDCHSTTGTSYANGPHGSTNRWMLRNQEPQTVSNITSVVNVTTVTNPFNFCLNCHSKNVYGDVAPAATTYAAGPNSNWGRITHTGWNDCIEDSQASNSAGNYYHVNCMNCHSGGNAANNTVTAWPGSLHGSSQAAGPNPSATTPRGFRFMNGAAWNGHTVGLTASTCYTAEVATSVSSCSSHDTGSNPATPNFRY